MLQPLVEPGQYTAIHFGETLLLAGLTGSVGSVGDAYDNALAETTIGLYKTECVREGSPFRAGPIATLADLEDATSAWVAWYNHHRLMHRLGRRPPAEAEAEYYTQVPERVPQPATVTKRQEVTTMPLRTCEWCTAPIRQAATGRTRRFCDGTCRQAAYRAGRLTHEYPEPWQRRALADGWRPPATF